MQAYFLNSWELSPVLQNGNCSTSTLPESEKIAKYKIEIRTKMFLNVNIFQILKSHFRNKYINTLIEDKKKFNLSINPKLLK